MASIFFKNFKKALCNLWTFQIFFAPQTIDQCFGHDGYGAVPGIADDNNKWNITGHNSRIVKCGAKELALFAKLYDDEGTDLLAARTSRCAFKPDCSGTQKICGTIKGLGDLKDEYFSTEMWHETNAQKDGTIRRQTCFPENTSQWILSGPHFYVGNPFYKTPMTNMYWKG